MIGMIIIAIAMGTVLTIFSTASTKLAWEEWNKRYTLHNQI